MRQLTAGLILSLCLGLFSLLYGETRADSPIFLNTLPKSGTEYIASTLKNFFDKHDVWQYSSKYYPGCQKVQSDFPNFSKNADAVIFSHLRPFNNHFTNLNKHYKKFLLHARDPRQALISYVHYLDKIHDWSPNEYHGRPYVAPREMDYYDVTWPDDYFELPFSKKVDYQINYYFTWMLTWLEEWIDTVEQNSHPDIKVTTFEKMTAEPLKFFKELVAFYGADPNDFNENHLLSKKRAHFRKGLKDEWRQVMTDKQIQRVNSMMSDRLIAFYGWQK